MTTEKWQGDQARVRFLMWADADPLHKTLFGTENRRGLPIGNLTSQFFSNVYLNELDQFVKHRLKARHYLRYSDDFVLVHENLAQLLAWREEIQPKNGS